MQLPSWITKRISDECISPIPGDSDDSPTLKVEDCRSMARATGRSDAERRHTSRVCRLCPNVLQLFKGPPHDPTNQERE